MTSSLNFTVFPSTSFPTSFPTFITIPPPTQPAPTTSFFNISSTIFTDSFPNFTSSSAVSVASPTPIAITFTASPTITSTDTLTSFSFSFSSTPSSASTPLASSSSSGTHFRTAAVIVVFGILGLIILGIVATVTTIIRKHLRVQRKLRQDTEEASAPMLAAASAPGMSEFR